MPGTTSRLGLNTFLETDVVDWDKINENFEDLDDMNLCIESGTKTSTYTGGSSSTATWRYKKYADGTVDMSTKIEYTNLRCNESLASLYYSGESVLNFPSNFSFSSVYDVQISLSSNTKGWPINITGESVHDHITFILVAMENEGTSGNYYKQVFVNVKGVLA